MRSKIQTKSGIEVEELENAFLDLNKEYEEMKQYNQNGFQRESHYMNLKNQFDLNC